MSTLIWDEVGKKIYETGVKKGVLFTVNNEGAYVNGVAWNGLSSVDENPTGAESTEVYADDIKYLDIVGTEKFEATIKAYTYPKEFAKCDGSEEICPGIFIGQQNRSTFGLSYVTTVGNDIMGNNYGYKIHIVYGAKAKPSAKTYSSINENPDAAELSWSITTTPVPVNTKIDGKELKPTSYLVLDSTVVPKAIMEEIEAILYGSDKIDPRLPLPDEIFTLAGGAVNQPGTESQPETENQE